VLLGIRWYDRFWNEVLQRTRLTSLSHLLSCRRISVFGHVARLDNVTPANMALQLHINVSLNRPPDHTWRRSPGRPQNKWLDQLRNDSTRPIGDLWRRAVNRGHGDATTWGPSPARRQWWWDQYDTKVWVYLHEVGERDANHQQFVNDLEQVGTGQHAVLQTIAQKVTVIRQHVIQVGHLHSSSSKLIQYTGNFQNCRSVFLKWQIAFLPYKQQRHCSLIVGYFFKKTTDFINDDKWKD